MKEPEMEKIANWIKIVSDEVKQFDYSDDKEERAKNLKDFYSFIDNNNKLAEIRKEINELCLKFPIYK
jgi:glycine/serine hydroxymethyltransferase